MKWYHQPPQNEIRLSLNMILLVASDSPGLSSAFMSIWSRNINIVQYQWRTDGLSEFHFLSLFWSSVPGALVCCPL